MTLELPRAHPRSQPPPRPPSLAPGTSAAAPSRARAGAPALGVLFGTAAVLSAYAAFTTTEVRTAALGPFFAEVFLLAAIAGVMALRDPEGRLRLSNPALMLLGWMFYYFVKPALAWLQGYRMALESPGTVLLDTDLVSQVQFAHCWFALSLYGAYFLVAPAAVPMPDPKGARDTSIRPLPFVLLGLLPYALNVVDRLMSGGSIVATASYGDVTDNEAESIVASRNTGGAGYLVTQVISKVWYLPVMSLGVGYYALLARFLRERRRLALAMFFAQIPVLLFFGNGGRSYTVFPFLIALILVDALALPLRWMRYLPAVAAAVQVFNFYGVFRGFQSEGPTGAFNASVELLTSGEQVLNTEDGIMLTKEAYCLLLASHGQISRGADYFLDAMILLLPSQIAPNKAFIRTTAEFLSDELLGQRRRGAGVAGTMVGDGLLIGGEIGVVVLGAVLGVILGMVVRWGYQGRDGAQLWRGIIMLLITAQTTQYVRADLVVVLTQIIYYVVLPSMMINLLLSTRMLDRSVWETRLAMLQRTRTSS